MSRRVVVCGSRGWRRPDLIGRRLRRLPTNTVVWHGDCPEGADLHAAMHCVAIGLEQRPIPADWKRHGLQAGPIRNRRLLDEARPSLVIAFWDGTSPGTGDMIDEARRRGIEVEITRREPATHPQQLAAFG